MFGALKHGFPPRLTHKCVASACGARRSSPRRLSSTALQASATSRAAASAVSRAWAPASARLCPSHTPPVPPAQCASFPRPVLAYCNSIWSYSYYYSTYWHEVVHMRTCACTRTRTCAHACPVPDGNPPLICDSMVLVSSCPRDSMSSCEAKRAHAWAIAARARYRVRDLRALCAALRPCVCRPPG